MLLPEFWKQNIGIGPTVGQGGVTSLNMHTVVSSHFRYGSPLCLESPNPETVLQTLQRAKL